MKMHKSEMPMRLRTFLPAFGDRLADQVHEVAEFLGKAPRTIEAYISHSLERMIPAEDYERLAAEWVRRKNRKQVNRTFAMYAVFDENGDWLTDAAFLYHAVYIADVDGVSYTPLNGFHCFQKPDERMQRRSRLRRLLRSGLVTREQVCEVFGVGDYCLTDYTLEAVSWLSTPDDFKLRVLEAFVTERLGEVA
ncbi:hypothetical protein [Rhizobium sp. L245/93]|uniref:hypothetical protein n=1 Tax=Rhizobium sp. L245/93 TaxID=2819998 RepID=UPI001ADACAED|nr:hypothetical protein [Rhizobium sp. L245/93]MBO9170898.1 hypothetical protein [Rhizobium sp. L245/93]